MDVSRTDRRALWHSSGVLTVLPGRLCCSRGEIRGCRRSSWYRQEVPAGLLVGTRISFLYKGVGFGERLSELRLGLI